MKKKLILGGLITLLTVSLIPFVNLFFKEQEKKEIENNVKEVVEAKESKKEEGKKEKGGNYNCMHMCCADSGYSCNTYCV